MARINAAPISYGGAMVSYGVQVNLTTPQATRRDLRYISLDAFPTEAISRRAQSNLGHRNDAEFTALGILHEAAKPDALQITIPITCGDDNTVVPPLMTFLASGGWDVVGAGGVSEVVGYNSQTDFGVAADPLGVGANNTDHGVSVLVELDDGRLWPTLMRTYSVDAVDVATCVPVMGLPSASANTRPVHGMWTAAPMIRPVGSSKLLTFQVRTRAASYLYTGCALSSMGELTVAPNGEMHVQCTFHVGKVEVTGPTMTGPSLVAEDFAMSLIENLWSCTQYQHAIGHADDPLTNTDLMVQRAVFRQHYTTKPQPGVGACAAPAVLNDIQGYIADRPSQLDDASQVECEMSAVFDDLRRAWFLARNEYHVAAVHPISALGHPAVIVAIPYAAYLAEPDDVSDDTEAGAITQTVRFGGRSARWDATDISDQEARGNRDFFIAIGGAGGP